jgi:hypothetical protein
MSRMKFFEKLDEILNWNAKTPEIQKKKTQLKMPRENLKYRLWKCL